MEIRHSVERGMTISPRDIRYLNRRYEKLQRETSWQDRLEWTVQRVEKLLKSKVGDFEKWLKGHEDRKRIFAPAVSSFKTFQDQDDPQSVVMVLEVTDMEKLGAMMNDPNTQEAKDRHTVKEPVLLSMPVMV